MIRYAFIYFMWYATDGNIVMYLNYLGVPVFSVIDLDDIPFESFVTEDVREKFKEAFSDPFLEIEWEKFKKT